MQAHRSFPARCGLSFLSGTVHSLAYPPLGWGWLVVPGLAGLLLALQGQHAQGPFTSTIRRETKLTFYTRCGWLTPWVAFALAAICWLWLSFHPSTSAPK